MKKYKKFIRLILSRYLLCCLGTLLLPGTLSAEPPAKTPSGHGASKKMYPANQLANETSPYLLLHAHNPVHWYPWNEAALAKAKKENKVIFLSIGYSSCYWCHVMERECFMNEEIAKIMNEHFICIKVDREERPDIDDLYMTSLQTYFRMTGSGQGGGWPMSMFLTPDGKPFFGGTYFPPKQKQGRPGFGAILTFIADSWKKQETQIRKDSEILVKAVKSQLEKKSPTTLSPLTQQPISDTLASLQQQFDASYGGFGYSLTDSRRPKFPEPSNLEFLLELSKQPNHEKAKAMLLKTLDKMAQGGIWDHLGGGFHRYSTDRYWHVPHFEKMLYDNGQLASVYAESYALTHDENYARITRELLDYVLREMTDPEGSFYSAMDAETDAEEGKFYAWTEKEIQANTSAEERVLLNKVYGFEASPVFDGKHVFLRRESLKKLAKRIGKTTDELLASLKPIHQKFLTERNKRKKPLLDDKLLTSWNGLMIRGFADAGRLLKEPKYTQAASRAAESILAKLKTSEGRLQRTHRKGTTKLNGYLDDYAFLTSGLIALHRATHEKKWLTLATELTDKQIELFWDNKGFGFFFTSHDHEDLFARIKKSNDSAIPAGNSVSVENLIYLSQHENRPDYLKKAKKTVQVNLPLLDEIPSIAPRLTLQIVKLLQLEEKK